MLSIDKGLKLINISLTTKLFMLYLVYLTINIRITEGEICQKIMTHLQQKIRAQKYD